MKNWKTSLAGLLTALGLVPTAIEQLNAIDLPHWLVVFGQVCAFISFIAQSFLQKDHNVSGVNKLADENKDIVGTRPTDR